MDHLYLDNVGEISYYGLPDHLHFPWRGSLADDDDEGLEPTIVRSMD